MAQRRPRTKITMREIKIFASIEELNEFAAHEFVRLSRESIEKRGQFTVALSGGSTPKKLNSLLASEKFRSQIEWQKIHFFFGDERHVAPEDEESNYRMANETLFSKLEIPAVNIHRFWTETGDVKIIAEKMEGDVRDFFNLSANEFPRFDLIFLGMGNDGHTASLFPGTAALDEERRIVIENYVPKFKTFRLTFTYPSINSARNVIFLIAGEDKAEALHEVLEGEFNYEKFPSQKIQPENGKLMFLVDEKAAANLRQK
jgi:6-phosphogluconolactonase